MFLNCPPSTADMMKCYKGQSHFATENVFRDFPLSSHKVTDEH